MVTQSLKLRYRRSVFSTSRILAKVLFLKNETISPKAERPVCLAVSTSTYSWMTVKSCAAAYSFKSFNCAAIEKPSFSCSLDETRA